MRGIFISYRREDAEGQSGRLFGDLSAHFGKDSVFMDVEGVEPGLDFRKAIDHEVSACNVLLAVIGKHWIDAKDESGHRRLDDPNDFVRLETATALKRDIPVIPVLVQGARMPRVDQLPADMEALVWRNAVELTHARWDSDIEILIKALCRHVEAKQVEKDDEKKQPAVQGEPGKIPVKRSWRFIVAGLVTVIALVIGGFILYKQASQPIEKVEWLTSEQYQHEFNKHVRDGFYPDKVEAKCENGYEQFHVVWKGLPLSVDFVSHHAVTKELYESKNQEYVSNGFALVSLNIFKDCSGNDRYQATWFKKG